MSHTIFVRMTVFAGDNMSKEEVIQEAERQLLDLLDGTDFMSITVDDAVKDDM